ncbi:Uu.00g103680.m01.CDS01 [Anthostomella pinea]|uniref:Uu.00g103680.m01.CDS01 n=1 Tax=Anthostomella pinea TaxID=933095 RepID=A0AAI8V8I0_9PEZI|nr:Uu.00g103680.m01.CDS01 [Anthostomella pinea]
MSIDTYKHMNPQLKGNCKANFWAGYAYCVDRAADDNFPLGLLVPAATKTADSPPKTAPGDSNNGQFITANPAKHTTDPQKHVDPNCKAAPMDQCMQVFMTLTAAPAPALDWCKRYLAGPKCTETGLQPIMKSYSNFPEPAHAWKQCMYPDSPPVAPKFSTACSCFVKAYATPA